MHDAQRSTLLSRVIEWPPEDQAYVVSLPAWADRYAMPLAEAPAPEKAAERGQNALENDAR